MSRTVDRLSGAQSTRGRKRTAEAEGRITAAYKLPPDLIRWIRSEATRRQNAEAVERIGGRRIDQGDLVALALAHLILGPAEAASGKTASQIIDKATKRAAEIVARRG